MLYSGGDFVYLWPSAVILCLPVGIGNDSHLKRAIISHKYENIQ